MSQRDSERHAGCPPEHVLEDWARGRLDTEAAAELATHLDACERCRRAAEALQHDGEVLYAWLSAREGGAEGDCLRVLDLARYRDNAMATDEREAAEGHLADCRRCRERLVALQAELNATRRGEGTESARRPAGDIVEMPEQRGDAAPSQRETKEEGAQPDAETPEPPGEFGAGHP